MASPMNYSQSPLFGSAARERSILGFFKGEPPGGGGGWGVCQAAAAVKAPAPGLCLSASAFGLQPKAKGRLPHVPPPAPPCLGRPCRPHAAGQPALLARHPSEA